MPLWRCYQPDCTPEGQGMPGRDFEADAPVCPNCKADKRKPECSGVIVKLETVHLHVKDPQGPDVGHGSRYRVACGGSFKGKRASAVPAAVNCPACRKTREYAALLPEEERYAKDYDIEVDLKAQQINLAGQEPAAAGK